MKNRVQLYLISLVITTVIFSLFTSCEPTEQDLHFTTEIAKEAILTPLDSLTVELDSLFELDTVYFNVKLDSLYLAQNFNDGVLLSASVQEAVLQLGGATSSFYQTVELFIQENNKSGRFVGRWQNGQDETHTSTMEFILLDPVVTVEAVKEHYIFYATGIIQDTLPIDTITQKLTIQLLYLYEPLD